MNTVSLLNFLLNIVILYLLLLILLFIINHCKLEFSNKITYNDFNELNKSKFYSIKGGKNEKSLINKIKNW